MPCTYNSTTNIILVTGYSEATPCNFTDIYNADVSGSWGVFMRQSVNQFSSSANIHIGDGTTATWFADIEKMVKIGSTGAERYLECETNSNFRLGEYANGVAKKGCYLALITSPSYVSYKNQEGTVKLYASILEYSGHYSNFRLTNVIEWVDVSCIFENIFFYGNNSGSLTRMNFTPGTQVYIYTSNLSFKDIYFQDAGSYGVTVGWGRSAILENAVFVNCATDIHIYQNSHISIINSTWDTSPHFSSSSSGSCQDQKTFDLKIVDTTSSGIPTTAVKIWDSNNDIVTNTTTNASGVLTTQTLLVEYWYNGGSSHVVRTPHEMRIYKYGKAMLSSKSSIEAKTDWAFTMYADDHITQPIEATVAAYTGITIDHTAETITISENHTLDEIYDYCQYDIIAATKQLNQTIHTADGMNFVSEYSFVVNTGITVTATDQKLSMVSGKIYTLTGTAQFMGIIATTTTTRIPIKLTNIVDGSRYWVGKESDGSQIFAGTQSGSDTVIGYYEHTANININIRVRKSSISMKYKPWIGEGTLVAEVFSLRIRQIPDGIAL